jgi:hypothetical protein
MRGGKLSSSGEKRKGGGDEANPWEIGVKRLKRREEEEKVLK